MIFFRHKGTDLDNNTDLDNAMLGNVKRMSGIKIIRSSFYSNCHPKVGTVVFWNTSAGYAVCSSFLTSFIRDIRRYIPSITYCFVLLLSATSVYVSSENYQTRWRHGPSRKTALLIISVLDWLLYGIINPSTWTHTRNKHPEYCSLSRACFVCMN